MIGHQNAPFVSLKSWLYFFYDVRKRGRRYWRRSLFPFLLFPRAEPGPVPRQAILMLAVILLIIIYHACFHFWSFTKICLTNLFMMWLLLLLIIYLTITLPVAKLGVTKQIATIWYIYHQKYNNMKSLSGHPKNVFLQNKGFTENPVERWNLAHGRNVKRIIFGERCFQKWHIT